jgi:hypothetical protein
MGIQCKVRGTNTQRGSIVFIGTSINQEIGATGWKREGFGLRRKAPHYKRFTNKAKIIPFIRTVTTSQIKTAISHSKIIRTGTN